MLSEKIKGLRRQAGLSQEGLAERLHVSRQAVTKWETGGGAPDIENLRAISALFGVTLDELLEHRSPPAGARDFLFESSTEYDIDCIKQYDITLAGAKQVTLMGHAGEKLEVRLASDRISDVQSAFKVKIDDVKQRIDVDVRRFGSMTETQAKEALYVFIRLPQRYVKRVELTGNTVELRLERLAAEGVEFSGKVSRVELDGLSGHVELNSSQDMEILCRTLDGRLDVNQLSSTSRLTLPAGLSFAAITRGMANRILWERDGRPAQGPGQASLEGDNIIELNGMRSELIINQVSGLPGGEG